MANIRIYFNLLLILIIGGIVTSCNNDESIGYDDDASNVKLTLTLGHQTPTGTRATDNGVDELNENVIKNVDVFFYRKNALITDQPIFSSIGIQIPDNTKGTAQMGISMPLAKYKELFPTENDVECLIYAIVNRPDSDSGDNALPDNKSLSSLKENTLLYAESFARRSEDPVTHLYSPSVQESFVMDGEAVVSRSGEELTGSIPVNRVAVKISLVINGIAEEVEDEKGDIWVSDINSVRLSLRRGSKRTKLGSTPTEYIYSADKDNDLFGLEAISLDNMENTNMTTNIPFYTYPTNWTNDENSRTHFILVVEWTKKNTSDRLTTFYEVNVNPSGSYTKRNYHYKISQEIRVLGSIEEETPEQLASSNYVILDWGSSMDSGDDQTDSDANLSRFKYLVVDETSVVMDNITSKRIPFFSSDPIDLSAATIQWQNVSGNISGTLTFATKDNASCTVAANGDIIYSFENQAAVGGVVNRIQGDYKVRLTIHNANPNIPGDQGYIQLEHPLNNGMNAAADYTEYTISLNVQHQGNDDYKETINIIQNPMIAIKADINTDWENDNRTNGNKGYVYINNAQSSSSGTYQVMGLSTSASNANPNRYIISVTSLPDTDIGKSYIIGDPRTIGYVDMSSTLNNDDRGKELTYYYPTDNSTRSTDLISPEFMVASSYAVHNAVNQQNAKNRCAAYQEDGYPAGRWRVPTRAEMRYIVQLSEWEVIPALFNPGGNYWSAQNVVSYTDNDGFYDKKTTTSAYVRCVYDIWYWGNDRLSNLEEFVYGDKVR